MMPRTGSYGDTPTVTLSPGTTLMRNRRILPLFPPHDKMVPFDPDALGGMIAAGDKGWMDLVPKKVQERIGELSL